MIFVLLFVVCQTGAAQYAEINTLKSSPGIFFLPAHTQLNLVAWRDSVYMFPTFRYGKIVFDTGHAPGDSLLLNYDLYLDRWDMININGDTLQIKMLNEIRLITFRSQIFFHDFKIGYIEIIQELDVALGVRDIMTTEHMQYVSGNKDGTIHGTDVRGMPSVYDRYYRKRKHYYFISKDNNALKANNSSLFKLFPEHKKSIKAYLAENTVNFNDKEQLIKLMTFCNSLE